MEVKTLQDNVTLAVVNCCDKEPSGFSCRFFIGVDAHVGSHTANSYQNQKQLGRGMQALKTSREAVHFRSGGSIQNGTSV